jgi:hypothetical protein
MREFGGRDPHLASRRNGGKQVFNRSAFQCLTRIPDI